MRAGLILALAFMAAPFVARALPPPSLPAVDSLAPGDANEEIDVIWYEVLIWGTIRYTWKIERGGEGRLRSVDEPEKAFAVSVRDFDRIHALMRRRTLLSRPARRCRPGATDGPYGSVHWRIRGRASELNWSSRYSCSNTDFIYGRIGAADEAVRALANRRETN